MNAWVISSIIIEKDGKFLLTQQAKGRFHEGKWAFPGGKTEKKETLLETAIREVKEETMLDVKPKSIIGIYEDFSSDKAIIFLFKGEANSFNVTIPDGEIEQFRWVTLSELRTMPEQELRPMMPQMIKDIVSGKEFSLDVLQGNDIMKKI